jgi:hypothetical protein
MIEQTFRVWRGGEPTSYDSEGYKEFTLWSNEDPEGDVLSSAVKQFAEESVYDGTGSEEEFLHVACANAKDKIVAFDVETDISVSVTARRVKKGSY